MESNFNLPPMGFGPGSQSRDDTVEYMPMPQDMRTFSPRVPEIEDPARAAPALDLLGALSSACARVAKSGVNETFALSGLDAFNRRLVAETMGEGEVSVRAEGIPAVAVQESVFAGVWVLQGAGIDAIEVAQMPAVAKERAFVPRREGAGADALMAPGVVNAPALFAELRDKSASWQEGGAPHVVNLTLLPHTEADRAALDTALGEGSVTILSRGYGNCRITATALRNVWRVQFFNSMDTLILDTFEVTALPEVALAAAEDLTDSADRLIEVREAIR